MTLTLGTQLMSLCSCTPKLARSSTDLESEASLDAHGCVMAQATEFDACAVLPQFSAIAASESACPAIATYWRPLPNVSNVPRFYCFDHRYIDRPETEHL